MASFSKSFNVQWIWRERKKIRIQILIWASTFILGFLCFIKTCCNRPYPDSPEGYYSPWYEIKGKIISVMSIWFLSFLFSIIETRGADFSAFMVPARDLFI